MKWVTRKTIRVNRTATAWLVRRFLDPAAEFLFVEPSEVAAVAKREGATGFDAPGAPYPHKDAKGLCSFAAIVHERCAKDRVLLEMARIVQEADLPGGADPPPEADGLRAISEGFPDVAKDDGETVERAAFLYDALYASLAARRRTPPGRTR
ncbi:MAG: chromate resistance protein [Planctomycetales bacterium]|nr:chromate resistance protein [Planctomycetales bacterium]